MNPTTLFYILISILIISFIIYKILDTLNEKHFDDEIPDKLKDVQIINFLDFLKNYNETKQYRIEKLSLQYPKKQL